jgi:hypothetical protein
MLPLSIQRLELTWGMHKLPSPEFPDLMLLQQWAEAFRTGQQKLTEQDGSCIDWLTHHMHQVLGLVKQLQTTMKEKISISFAIENLMFRLFVKLRV